MYGEWGKLKQGSEEETGSRGIVYEGLYVLACMLYMSIATLGYILFFGGRVLSTFLFQNPQEQLRF